MDDEIMSLLSTLGNDETVARLRNLLERSAKSGDCSEERRELEELKMN